ncbi:hypothetical protein EB796_024419 [Bugula neritina]|uniref:SH3 domain-containing protein n=1 Tax=Bugula neritina TaxID=10212 RepID=A0A7J7IVL9_BUGNE|nr:hypothetical protein EB796_024419 [Bugula neritina]
MNPVCCVYMMLPENSDPVYSLLKGAFMLRKGGEGDSSGVSSMRSLPRQSTASSGRSVSSRSSSPATKSASFSTTARPRQMLNKRMKSFSLDTPDAPKQVDESTKMKSSSYTNSTNIPGSNSSQACRRHMMFVRNKGMSIDYDDQISSSAGDRIAILDTSDPEWWFGSIEKRLGYFPHRYVLPFCEGQRLYRVGKPITLRANDEQDVKLLRGQVVIARGGEEFGNLNILSNDMKTGRMNEALCPIRYLQELFI